MMFARLVSGQLDTVKSGVLPSHLLPFGGLLPPHLLYADDHAETLRNWKKPQTQL